jgi:hypothetical protein
VVYPWEATVPDACAVMVVELVKAVIFLIVPLAKTKYEPRISAVNPVPVIVVPDCDAVPVPVSAVASNGHVLCGTPTLSLVAIGVVNVGEVENTNEPVPVSSVIAAKRFALDGVPKNVAIPVPSPVRLPTDGAFQVLSPRRNVEDDGVPVADKSAISMEASST